jgi:hypothetical protein
MNLRGGVLEGVQVPRLRLRPEAVSSGGQEAIDLAASCGLHLMQAQQLVLDDWHGEREDGTWAAYEAALIESRQNGKGGVTEADILEGLFLSEIALQLYTAHLFPTAMEMFRRVLNLIEARDDLAQQIRRVSNSHGEEGIELRTGQRVLFKTRTANAGRGMTIGRLHVDECFNYSAHQAAALSPTVSAAYNPQIRYTSSPGDRDLAPCDVLARLRRRAEAALAGKVKEPRLAFSEFSVPYDSDTGRVLVDPSDPASWAMGNPAMNILIPEEVIDGEYRSMAPRDFARERLGVGYWPLEEGADRIIPEFVWSVAQDDDSHITDRLMFAVEVTPEQSSASICAAGFYDYLDDEEPGDVENPLDATKVWHVEVVEGARAGTTWVVPRLRELCEAHSTSVIVDAKAPAASLIPDLELHGVPFIVINTAELVDASATFFRLLTHKTEGDGIKATYEPMVRHLDQRSLADAVASAVKRDVGDGWKFGRKPKSGADVTPLIGCVLALHGAMNHADDNYDVLASVY